MTDAALTDDVEAAYERQVETVAQRLLKEIKDSDEAPIGDVLTRIQDELQVSRAVARDALVQLLYSGAIELTEERHVVQG